MTPLPLEHWRSCSSDHDPEARCTCGLSWRIRLATEQEMSAAWRKRAEEAEARELAAWTRVWPDKPPTDIPGDLADEIEQLRSFLSAASWAAADLVALVREWQAAKRAVDALNADGGGPSPKAFEAACDAIDAAVCALLAYELPAAAPRVPDRDTTGGK